MLLPRITALGALDETPLALAGALALPPAAAPMQRLAALSTLILAMRGKGGAPQTADRAWLLARELASLMDEAERAGIDLGARLPDAADPEYAAHWTQTLEFLHIVTGIWPAWLAENGVMNPAARQVALLDAQARAWEDHPPDHPVLIAGTTAGIPAVARLLRVVARLPLGRSLTLAWTSQPGPGSRRLTPRLDWHGCWPTSMRPVVTFGHGKRRSSRRSRRRGFRRCRGRCCRRARCTTGWTGCRWNWAGCRG